MSFVIMFLLMTNVCTISSYIVEKPINTYGIVGEPLTLFCSISDLNSAVYWQYYSTLDNIYNVYNSLQVNNKFSNRIEVIRYESTDEDGKTSLYYNLYFKSIEMRDAGTYTCQDSYGIGDAKGASLVVLESREPICNLQKNVVNLFPGHRNTRIDCFIRYSGSYRPYFVEKDCPYILNEPQKYSNNDISSIIIDIEIPSKEINSNCTISAYFSNTSSMLPDNTQLSWTWNKDFNFNVIIPVNIITFNYKNNSFIEIGNEIIASTIAYPLPTYIWRDLNNKTIVNEGSILLLTSLGTYIYECHASNIVTFNDFLIPINYTSRYIIHINVIPKTVLISSTIPIVYSSISSSISSSPLILTTLILCATLSALVCNSILPMLRVS